MGLFRKAMSASTMGMVNWRNDSERQAAAERSKSSAYRERTRAMAQEAERDRNAYAPPRQTGYAAVWPPASSQKPAAPEKPAPVLPPPGFYDDPNGGPGKVWFDGNDWTEIRQS